MWTLLDGPQQNQIDYITKEMKEIRHNSTDMARSCLQNRLFTAYMQISSQAKAEEQNKQVTT